VEGGRQRRASGTTSLRAVWVSEKRTTLLSTRPAPFAASITTTSPISGRRLGDTTQIAPLLLISASSPTSISSPRGSAAWKNSLDAPPPPRTRARVAPAPRPDTDRACWGHRPAPHPPRTPAPPLPPRPTPAVVAF